MRRNVIQHFANMLPRRFLDLPEGIDLAILAQAAAGDVEFDLLRGTASIDGVPHPRMRTALCYGEWLAREATAHGIPMAAFSRASMRVAFDVTGLEVREAFGHVSRAATFTFACTSEVSTEAKSHTCEISGSRAWGYGHYWEQVFGTHPRI